MESRQIPKIIHFIWAGGDNPMPAVNRRILLSWKEANPTCQVVLWVDKKSCSSAEQWGDIQFIYQGLVNSGVVIKDIEDDPKISNEIVRYEIDRLRPNYGASSDLLRYRILHRYGGAYFDSDVLPGSVSLENGSIFEPREEHVLYIDKNSQDSGRIGNDALIATPDNPLVHAIYQLAENNYRDAEAWYNTPHILAYYYDEHKNEGYIEKSTVFRTGPGCVDRVCRDEIENESPYIQSIGSLVTHRKNDRKWINKKISKLTLEQSLKLIAMSIEFEARVFKILRLDGHVDNLKNVFNLSRSSLELSGFVLDIVKDLKIDLSCLAAIQINFSHPETVAFCQENNVLDKAFLFPSKAENDLVKNLDVYEDTINYIFGDDRLSDLLVIDLKEANAIIGRSIAFLNKVVSDKRLWQDSPMRNVYIQFLQSKISEMINNILQAPNNDPVRNKQHSDLRNIKYRIGQIKMSQANSSRYRSSESVGDEEKKARLLKEIEERRNKKTEAEDEPSPRGGCSRNGCNLL